MIRVVIVDDELLARQRLRALLAECDVPVEIIGEASNGEEAVQLIAALRPGLVFLDIQMPLLDGFDVVELLAAPRPHIVFVTAYDQHALRAFEVHALDYLTKPVRLARLKDTMARIAHTVHEADQRGALDGFLNERPAHYLVRLVLHVGRRLRVVSLADVRWIEARDKLVLAHTADGAHQANLTLDELEGRLDPAVFLRVHRSSIVNITHVCELLPWFAGTCMVKLTDGTQLQVARRRVAEVRRVLGGG